MRIDNPADGTSVDGYQLANLLGRTACIDVARSSVEKYPHDDAIMFIDSLALDEAALTGVKTITCAEHAQVIVVHESVMQAGVDANISGVKFFKPDEFSL